MRLMRLLRWLMMNRKVGGVHLMKVTRGSQRPPQSLQASPSDH